MKQNPLTVKAGTGQQLDDGSEVFGLADVQRADGSTIEAADVAFAYNQLGYRTRVDGSGNTVFEFESGGALHYRNMDAAGTDFNLGTDAGAAIWIGATGVRGAVNKYAMSKNL